MSAARQKILTEIREAAVPLRSSGMHPVAAITFANKTNRFIQSVEANGGKVLYVNDRGSIDAFIESERNAGKQIRVIGSNEKLNISLDAIYNIDTVVITGSTAVAENGAVWISEKQMGHRLLPFTCEQLVLIVEEFNIVNNLHEAYASINIADTAYGVFIAGPSKTADIEQSLVIGAHGPITHLVFLISSQCNL